MTSLPPIPAPIPAPGALAASAQPGRRRHLQAGPRRRLIREVRQQWPFVLVLLVAAAGLLSGVLWPQHWLRGVTIFAAGVVLGGLLRLLLSDVGAGILKVRSKLIDIVVYGGLGVLVFTFGVLVHR